MLSVSPAVPTSTGAERGVHDPAAVLLRWRTVAGPQPLPLRDLDADIDRSAAPGVVRAALQRVTAGHPQCIRWFEERGRFRQAIVAVAGASRSLTRLVESDPDALDVLGDLDRRPVLE